MQTKRLFVSLGLAFLLLVSLIGTGFSVFYLNETDKASSETSPRVDDIEENYVLQDAGDSSNYYDVYFFLTPFAAFLDSENLIQSVPGTDYNNAFEEYRTQVNKGSLSNSTLQSRLNKYYWDDSSSNKEEVDYSSQTDGNNVIENGWRKIRVYRSISIDEFNNIGIPRAGKGNSSTSWDGDSPERDGSGWPYDFSGWTANKNTAQNLFIVNQGDYDYVDAFSPLSIIDSGTSDGSDANDNVVFLFPIFTTGKNTSNNNYEPVVRLSYVDSGAWFEDPTNADTEIRNTRRNHLFFAQNDKKNEAVYTYKNLTVGDDFNKYRLEVSVMNTSANDGWTANWASTQDTDNAFSLFQSSGTYNITVHLYNWCYADSDKFGNPNNFVYNMIEETKNTSSTGVVVNDIVFASQATGTEHKKEWLGWQPTGEKNFADCYSDKAEGCSAFVCYIQVERVYEFHLLGGPSSSLSSGGTFDYERTQAFYQGQIASDGALSADKEDSNQTGYITETYGLNNVFIDASSDSWFNDNYVGVSASEENTRSGRFRKNVFAIDFANTLWKCDIKSFTDSELKAINDFSLENGEISPSYISISSNDFLQLATPKETEDQLEYDYALSNVTDPEAVRTLLKITKTGFYNFRFLVTYYSTVNDPDKLQSYVKSIKLAVSPVKKEYFVKIFDNNDFDYHLTQINDSEAAFVTHKNPKDSNPLRYEFNFNEYGTELTTETEVEVISTSDGTKETITMGNILETYDLYDHVTGMKIKLPMTLEKNYVLYLKAKNQTN